MTGRLRIAFREFWFVIRKGHDRQQQTTTAVLALLAEFDKLPDDAFLAGHGIAPIGGAR